MSTYILHVESGLRIDYMRNFDFSSQVEIIARILHEQKGFAAEPATYTFKLMSGDEYAGKTAQILVKPVVTLQAIEVPRGEQ